MCGKSQHQELILRYKRCLDRGDEGTEVSLKQQCTISWGKKGETARWLLFKHKRWLVSFDQVTSTQDRFQQGSEIEERSKDHTF